MSGYKRPLVEQLLPAVWDSQYAYGMRNPAAPDPDMPKGTVDKKASGTLNAHLADIRWAWRTCDLALAERQALLLRFGLDYHDKDIAVIQDVTDRAVRYRVERGVGKLTAHLNGAEYVDGYDDDDV